MEINSKNTFESQYVTRGASSQRSYPNEALIQFVAANWFKLPMNERKNIRILELGSGSGANLWMLAKEGFDTYGIDLSVSGNQLAEKILKEKWNVSAKIQAASFEKLPFEDQFFDAVVDVVSLQHLTLKESYETFPEIKRVLKKDGKFFSYRLSHSCSAFTQRVDELLDEATLVNISPKEMPLNNNGQTSFWSEKNCKDVYGKADFKIKTIERYSRTYDNNSLVVEYFAIEANI